MSEQTKATEAIAAHFADEQDGAIGTAEGSVDSFVEAASVTCGLMIVSYSIVVDFPRPRCRRFRWWVASIKVMIASREPFDLARVP